jgi:hypothetical protein
MFFITVKPTGNTFDAEAEVRALGFKAQATFGLLRVPLCV